MLALEILVSWFAADFLTGLFHWWQDKYMDEPQWAWANELAKENERHHTKPTAMVLSSGWTNMQSAAVVGWPLAAILWALGLPTMVWLTIFFATFGNLVHRWSHIPRRRLPIWIRFLQSTGLFISQLEHDLHHRSMRKLIPRHEAGYKFCAMSNWVNPILDSTGFWSLLEAAFSVAGFQTTSQRKASN